MFIHIRTNEQIICQRVPHAEMIAYGIAKAAVHQLVKSLSAPKSGLPNGATVAAILPCVPSSIHAMTSSSIAASRWTRP